MAKRGVTGLLIAAGFVLAACDDPTAPEREIAGAYELTARVENEIQTPVVPGSPGATLTLRPDRTWVLTRHRSGGFDPLGGFGLADTYQLERSGSGFSLAMFTEAPFIQTLSGAAFVDGDTLRWGAEIFVRR